MAMRSRIHVHTHGRSYPMAEGLDPETELVHGSFTIRMTNRYRRLFFFFGDEEPTVLADFQVGLAVRHSFPVPVMPPRHLKNHIRSVMSGLIHDQRDYNIVSEKLTNFALCNASGNAIKTFHVAANIEFLKEHLECEGYHQPEIMDDVFVLDGMVIPNQDSNPIPVQPSLPRTAIEALKMVKFEGGEADRCSVCLEDFTVDTELVSTPCCHLFHQSCIVPWLKRNNGCPICRSPVSD